MYKHSTQQGLHQLVEIVSMFFLSELSIAEQVDTIDAKALEIQA